MSDLQFILLATINIITLVASVEFALWRRTKHINDLFERALAHGGSLDTFVRSANTKAVEANTIALAAVEATRMLKERVDHHERSIAELQNHPILRPPGGHR